MNGYIDRNLLKRVLMVGEYFQNDAPGGITSVLRSYSEYFGTFRFIASSRRRCFRDKLIYDAGGLLKLICTLLLHPGIKLVYIHTAADGSFMKHRHYVRAARLLGRKVVIHSHASRFKDFYNEADDRKKEKILATLNSCAALVVLSKSWHDWFVGIGVDASNVKILNNITPFPKPVDRVADGKLHLLFLGVLGQRKGVFDALAAIAGKEQFRGRLDFHIGGNTNEDKLIAAIAEYGLEDIVTFDGYVTKDRKRALLSWADVLILPSYNEGLPISILEAMSYGCAIISTPVGGIPEVVSERNGILHEPGNLEQICEAVTRMLTPGLAEKLGQESREVVKAYYPDAVAAGLEDVLKGIIQP